ncbi:MAG: hypothetical protein IPP46_19870 [Bacteroidetes bacterium]|nr:hypothetical protein [Bacteroidota bacterium]
MQINIAGTLVTCSLSFSLANIWIAVALPRFTFKNGDRRNGLIIGVHLFNIHHQSRL